MADLDTKLKRASGLYVISPWRQTAKFPTGSFIQDERQSVALMYSGIAASNPGAPTFLAAWARNSNMLIRTLQ